MIKAAVDVMGGDYAPGGMAAGIVEAVSAKPGVQVFLVGQEQAVVSELSKHTRDRDRIQIMSAAEVITTEGPSVNAIRKEKSSFTVVGLNLIRQGEANTFVSTGSSGAILVDEQVMVGRSKSMEHPPLALLIPIERGVSLSVDCRANVDARTSYLVQFTQVGSIHMEYMIEIRDSRVVIVNIGAEEEKGNALVKETFPLLRGCKEINFTGSIEAGEVPHDGADVIVCEASVGNIILKLYEEVGVTLISMVKGGMMPTLCSRTGALLVKPTLKGMLKSLDGDQYGGAPLLGLKGLVAKTRGNSKHTEVRNPIIQYVALEEQDINGKIRQCLSVQNEGQVRRTK